MSHDVDKHASEMLLPLLLHRDRGIHDVQPATAARRSRKDAYFKAKENPCVRTCLEQ